MPPIISNSRKIGPCNIPVLGSGGLWYDHDATWSGGRRRATREGVAKPSEKRAATATGRDNNSKAFDRKNLIRT